jgi:hypothetical protein
MVEMRETMHGRVQTEQQRKREINQCEQAADRREEIVRARGEYEPSGSTERSDREYVSGEITESSGREYSSVEKATLSADRDYPEGEIAFDPKPVDTKLLPPWCYRHRI